MLDKYKHLKSNPAVMANYTHLWSNYPIREVMLRSATKNRAMLNDPSLDIEDSLVVDMLSEQQAIAIVLVASEIKTDPVRRKIVIGLSVAIGVCIAAVIALAFVEAF